MAEILLDGMDETGEIFEDEEAIAKRAGKQITKKELDKLKQSTDFRSIIKQFDGLWETGLFTVEIERIGPEKDSDGNPVQCGRFPEGEKEGYNVDEAYISSRYGGGSFKIVVRGPRPDPNKGGFGHNRVQLVQSGVFRISGEPKSPEIDAAVERAVQANTTANDPAQRMFDLLTRQMEEAKRENADLRAMIMQTKEAATNTQTSALEALIKQMATDKNTVFGMYQKVAEKLSTPPERNAEDSAITTELIRGSNSTVAEMQREHREAMAEQSRRHSEEMTQLRESQQREISALRDSADRRERDEKDRYDERLRATDQSWQGRLASYQERAERADKEAERLRDKYDALVLQLQDAKVSAATASAAKPAGNDLSSLEGFASMAQKLREVSSIFGGGPAPELSGVEKYVAIAQAVAPMAEKTLGTAASVMGRYMASRGPGGPTAPPIPNPGPEATQAWQQSRRGIQSLPGLPPPSPMAQEPESDLPTSLASEPIRPSAPPPAPLVSPLDAEEPDEEDLTDMDDGPALSEEQKTNLRLLQPMLTAALEGGVAPEAFADEVRPFLGTEGVAWIKEVGPSEVITAVRDAIEEDLDMKRRSYLRKAIGALMK
jgi:hypothetical protein